LKIILILILVLASCFMLHACNCPKAETKVSFVFYVDVDVYLDVAAYSVLFAFTLSEKRMSYTYW